MSNQLENINKGFSSVYDEYEKIDQQGIVAKWMRKRVHKHLLNYLNKDDEILELNAGSGIDAFFLAKKGFKVFATDVSNGFVEYFSKKINKEQLESKIEFQQLSFTEISSLNRKFDYIFSNFGGLNCIENLDDVLLNFDKLLNPGGKVSLVIMPKICFWEWLWFYKSFKKAFRRLKSKPEKANVDGFEIDVWYHNYKTIIKYLEKDFKLLKVENLAFFAPTGANDDFAIKFPKIYKILTYLDEKLNFLQARGIGDYFIISLEKR